MMSTYVDLHGDPDDVTSTGARLKAEADSFGGKAQSILNDIVSLEAGAPWGGDEPGQAFADQYNHAPENGTAFSESLRKELGEAGKHLGDTGDAIMQAMVQYQSTDITNTNDIKNIKNVKGA